MSKKQERTFRISENNKGLMCPFKEVVCQEGYCHYCQIYLDWLKLRGKAKVDRSGYETEDEGF